MTYLYLIQCLLALSHIHAAAGETVKSDIRGRYTGALTETFVAPTSCLSEIITLTTDFPSMEVGCRAVGTGSTGNECCPPNWATSRYYSPGVCPKDYQACTLPTTAQRRETTNLCCPSNYDCPTDVYPGLCYSFINTQVAVVYEESDKTYTAHMSRVTATPIQIRFKATDSDVVPIPTESFDLPVEKEKTGRELPRHIKVFIGIGIIIGVIALSLICRYFYVRLLLKRQRGAESETQDTALLAMPSEPEDAPPPYEGRK
ncbi:uncharacterized protein DNG_04702 [Cephalotrichum gorgonifer]|uniref:Uncharacterized protein n=1 Tax=Cephalotrichum gorgonifer TaxID=2041049 RepID=A0AAE8MYD4_9PEZI|nr:uncharacterized protein DNG_04702 [Cephalotrichum gorgonifer]